MNLLKNFVRDEQGQDLIEYALLLGFMVVAGSAAIQLVTGNIKTIWQNTNDQLDLAAGTGGGAAS